MFVQGNKLVSIIEEFAPPKFALEWDSTGLQWGDLRRDAPAVLMALDFSAEVLEEALEAGASFVFTHHPYLFQPLKRIDLANPRDNLIARALAAGITLYCAHTNLDVAPGGVNDALAELLGLENTELLAPIGAEDLEKLVTFIPEGYEDRVRDALAEAGAGWIGNYSHCTYQLMGTGTFLPREGADPFLGATGRLEKVAEYRLETILPKYRRKDIVEALLAAHPYEEVAYDLYPLSREGDSYGLGRIGELKAEVTLKELAESCRDLLRPDYLKVHGDLMTKVRKAAVLGGSGGDYIGTALQKGADVFITGDLKFHQAQEAALYGLPLIDAGHDATEWPAIPALADVLREKMQQNNYQTKILVSKIRKKMWQIIS